MSSSAPGGHGLKAVIFDLDGVVANTHPIHLQAWKAFLAEQGLNLSDRDLSFFYAGRSRNDILHHYLGPLEDHKLDSLGRRKDELYQALACNLQPEPELLRVLDELDSAGIPFALATSAGRVRTMETLQKFQIAGRFAAVMTGQDVRAPKPAPEIFLLAASHLGVAPRECLVVEDSRAGVEAALAAGMKCLGYAPPERVSDLLVAAADDVVSRFPQPAPAYFAWLFEAGHTREDSPQRGRSDCTVIRGA
jgi:beta-phosphoglucomutase family hydrolase